MRLLGSVVLLAGAFAAAAYAYLPVVSLHRSTPAHIGGKAVEAARATVSASSSERSFSPALPQFGQSVAELTLSRAVPDRVGSEAWRAVVNTEPGTARQAASGDYVASVELARQLQRELKRVGCYDGDADGDWKTASRRAMSAFLTKVNATLPTDQPDYILLTLLQGHADRACGVACPSGQAVSSNGRCIPNVVVAETARPAAQGTATVAVQQLAAATSVAKPAVAAAPAAGSARAGHWSATITQAPLRRPTAERQPVVAQAIPASPPQTAGAVPEAVQPVMPTSRLAALPPPAQARVPVLREPLPGRMAIGAMPADDEPAAVIAPPAAAGGLAAMQGPAARPARQPPVLAALDPDLQAPAPQIRRDRAEERSRPQARASSHHAGPQPRAPQRYVRSYSDGPTVRTAQGKVRRHSPQHNLMLSLGGVF